MRRRIFLQSSLLTSASMLLCRSGWTETVSPSPVVVDLTMDLSVQGHVIPPDFTGLSYEQTQLSNPEFFSASNSQLVGMISRLGRHGVLRLGGDTSEYTFWDRSAKPSGISLKTTAGPDTGQHPIRPATITPDAIRQLKTFLDQTGWSVIYGLNLGQGTPERAADEAAFVMQTLGREKILAFQIGNEPDAFTLNRLRPNTWGLDDYLLEWDRFFQAVRARVPGAPFAGPDTATHLNWLLPFARKFQHEIKFLSSHYYAVHRPTGTIDRLLTPNERLQLEIAAFQQAEQETGLKFRMTETNSCPSGKEGVSDTFGAAIWAADYMYQLAEAGCIGINFHGGGYGWYTPIAGNPENGFLARPEYYGLLLFAKAGPGRLVSTKLSGTEASPHLTAYALRGLDGRLRLALFNKNVDRNAVVRIHGANARSATVTRLTAPRLSDTTDVTLAGSVVGADGNWTVLVEERLSSHEGVYSVSAKRGSGVLIVFG